MGNFKVATAGRIRMERKIVYRIIDYALAHGHTVSVFDGEDWTVVRSTDKNLLRDSVATTDEEHLVIRSKEDGKRLGWIQLVYGNNGYDVISDYTCTDFNEKMMAKIEPMIEKMELAV